jgi:hypothetical protein
MLWLHRRLRRRRGGLMFEFALLLPVVVFLIGFTVDMGRLVSLSSTLHDASAVAARSGARQGFAGSIPGGVPCNEPTRNGSNPSYDAFCEAFRPIPGSRLISVELRSPSSDGTGRWCSRNYEGNLYVSFRARAHLDYITPGIESVIAVTKGGRDLVATGVARCEVAR